MSNDEVSRGIIQALLKLANSAQFTCDVDGATAIAQLTTGANNHIETLTNSIEASVADTELVKELAEDEVIDSE